MSPHSILSLIFIPQINIESDDVIFVRNSIFKRAFFSDIYCLNIWYIRHFKCLILWLLIREQLSIFFRLWMPYIVVLLEKLRNGKIYSCRLWMPKNIVLSKMECSECSFVWLNTYEYLNVFGYDRPLLSKYFGFQTVSK